MQTYTKLSPHQVVAQAEGSVVSDMDGEKVMFSVKHGKYYNLGEIGGRVWDCISTPLTTRAIVAILTVEYEIEPEACEQQVLAFLEKLLAEGLVYAGDKGLPA